MTPPPAIGSPREPIVLATLALPFNDAASGG